MPERPVSPDTVREVRTTVTFPDSLVEALRAEAKRQGMSLSQYIREASVGRLMFDLGHRRDTQAREVANDLAEALKLAHKVVPPSRRPSEE